jgi:hypothetical protein
MGVNAMEQLAYSINETAKAFKLGRRTLVKADSIRRLINGQG